MISKRLKTAVLTLLVTCAVGALAPTAQADPVFEASNSSGTVSGSGNGFEQFVTEAGTITCSVGNYTGSYSSKTFSTQRLHPSYSSCSAFGFLSATVNTEDCDFILDPYEKVVTWGYHLRMAIDCPAGDSIKVTASTCSMRIEDTAANQNLTKIVSLDASGGIILEPEVIWIQYNVTNDGFLCPFFGTGIKNDGRFDPTAVIPITAAGGATITVVGE
ncbi:MAG TPA: hypothetical protein VFB52_08250 [Solirubrobacterales bacterium]|nr:hypothetical protein [Solirubrobacterales bacterium]